MIPNNLVNTDRLFRWCYKAIRLRWALARKAQPLA